MTNGVSKFNRVQHNTAPGVWTLDSCVNSTEAEAICEIASDKMTKAVVSGSKSGVMSKGRTNSVAWVKHGTNTITKSVADRVATIVGIPLDNAENFQVIRYEPGQEYRPHFDAYNAESERGQRTMKNGGQRIVTALCYLNEVESGGETHFPKLNIKVEPALGRLLIFENCKSGSNVRTELSLHAGLPVEKGIKWAFNLWFRERPIIRHR